MKKIALFAGMAISAVSCSNNEVLETLSEQNEIRFASVQMSNSTITKANPMYQILTGNETFGVYALYNGKPYFENVRLSKKKVWELDSKYYYPTGNFEMKMVAYGTKYDENKPTSVSSSGALTYTDYSVENQGANNQELYERFVISKAPESVSRNVDGTVSAVSLNFWHALSKIKFTAKLVESEDFANVVTKVKSITINTSEKGNLIYEGASSKWTPNASKVNKPVSLLPAAAKLTSTATEVSNEYYVIPLAQDGTNTIQVEVELLHAPQGIVTSDNIVVGTASATINATAAQLAINNMVTYNLIIDRSASTGLTEITFGAPTIEAWKPVDGGETQLPVPTPQP